MWVLEMKGKIMTTFNGRLFIWLWTLIWLIFIGLLIIFWKQLPWYLLALFTVIEVIFVPDTRLLKESFARHPKWSKEDAEP
jgi:hypothetical protein